jgi:hypothetical protein
VSLWERLWRLRPAAPATSAPPPVAPVLAALAGLPPRDRQCILLRDAIRPAAAELAPLVVPTDQRAELLMLAIASQESDALHRTQFGGGPARGLWQFERGGGVWGVMTHYTSAGQATTLLEARGIETTAEAAWRALERDDVLAAAFARLLLWTDPRPLPATDNEAGGWAYYLRTWRPGRPRQEKWPGAWRLARAALALPPSD